MAGVFTTPTFQPQAIPPTPSITNQVAQQASDTAAKEARMKRGRASTILTNPGEQRESTSRQQYLGGV